MSPFWPVQAIFGRDTGVRRTDRILEVSFDTEMTIAGPYRRPAQMLADQAYDGHASVHDDATAASMGLTGAPIEAPTHFSQFDPLGFLLWGQAWFERGCISSHFRTMVVEGEEVQASLTTGGSIEAHKRDGAQVLTGTMSVGPDYGDTELERRLGSAGEPGELFVIDQLEVGMREEGDVVSVGFDEKNGIGYPFTLAEKLARITEPHRWYSAGGGAESPWGRPMLPIEMISVLAHKKFGQWPIRTPYLGLFLDMEIRLVEGPVFVGQEYSLTKEIVALGQSRRTESYWTRSKLTDLSTGRLTAEVLLHSGVFKDSYPGYPVNRAGA